LYVAESGEYRLHGWKFVDKLLTEEDGMHGFIGSGLRLLGTQHGRAFTDISSQRYKFLVSELRDNVWAGVWRSRPLWRLSCVLWGAGQSTCRVSEQANGGLI